ncbi:hypothetical protein GGR56DRAFT_190781 [Xylariaceae sp. FL0804]|nr:hypothetical protein GGR56DRAFT_190781 [Xylariaceae sp. FL0804]
MGERGENDMHAGRAKTPRKTRTRRGPKAPPSPAAQAQAQPVPICYHWPGSWPLKAEANGRAPLDRPERPTALGYLPLHCQQYGRPCTAARCKLAWRVPSSHLILLSAAVARQFHLIHILCHPPPQLLLPYRPFHLHHRSPPPTVPPQAFFSLLLKPPPFQHGLPSSIPHGHIVYLPRAGLHSPLALLAIAVCSILRTSLSSRTLQSRIARQQGSSISIQPAGSRHG